MEEIYNGVVEILKLAQKMTKDYDSKILVPQNIVELASLEKNIAPLIKGVNEEKVQKSWEKITSMTYYILIAKDWEVGEFRDNRFKYISTVSEETVKIKEHLLKDMSPDIRFAEALNKIVGMTAYSEDDISGGLLPSKEIFILCSTLTFKELHNELISIFQQIAEDGELKEQVYQIDLIIEKYIETKHPKEQEVRECIRCIKKLQELAFEFQENKNTQCLR